MKPLICPQCGGKITDYKPWDNFAVCGYCETRFVIAPEKPKPIPEPPPLPQEPVYESFKPSSYSRNVVIAIVGGGLLSFVILVVAMVVAENKMKTKKAVLPRSSTPSSFAATPTPVTLSATPDPRNLLEFGSKGSSIGAFVDSDAIAVDKQNRIYVADKTMRIQQFDEKGNYLKTLEVPKETKFYKRARRIEKIGIDDKNRLFVLIDYGVVLVYDKETSSEPDRIVHFAPNPIQDFAFHPNGGRVFLVTGEQSEYLVQVTDAGKTVRRINAFHTNAADAQMSSPEVGLVSIRAAIDGAGNIFSVYALGDLPSYQLSYDSEDFKIFRFTPEGKFVNKFALTVNSCGIAIDSQNRIYITDGNSVLVYDDQGELVSTVYGFRNIDDFALDKQNFIYILANDRVYKRPAV